MRIPSSRAEQSAGPSLDDCGVSCNSELHYPLQLGVALARVALRRESVIQAEGRQAETEFLFSAVTPLGALPLGDVVWQEKEKGGQANPAKGPPANGPPRPCWRAVELLGLVSSLSPERCTMVDGEQYVATSWRPSVSPSLRRLPCSGIGSLGRRHHLRGIRAARSYRVAGIPPRLRGCGAFLWGKPHRDHPG